MRVLHQHPASAGSIFVRRSAFHDARRSANAELFLSCAAPLLAEALYAEFRANHPSWLLRLPPPSLVQPACGRYTAILFPVSFPATRLRLVAKPEELRMRGLCPLATDQAKPFNVRSSLESSNDSIFVRWPLSHATKHEHADFHPVSPTEFSCSALCSGPAKLAPLPQRMVGHTPNPHALLTLFKIP